MNEQINQVIQAMGTMMTLGMVGSMAAPVMLQAQYYWVIGDYEKKEFWGMAKPQPSIDEAVAAAKSYIKQKGFPVGGVYAIEVYSRLPKILGRGTPIRREFIEVE